MGKCKFLKFDLNGNSFKGEKIKGYYIDSELKEAIEKAITYLMVREKFICKHNCKDALMLKSPSKDEKKLFFELCIRYELNKRISKNIIIDEITNEFERFDFDCIL